MSNGIKYVGQFKKNKMHGQGIMINADGLKITGRWENKQFIEE